MKRLVFFLVAVLLASRAWAQEAGKISDTDFRGRRAVTLENERIAVTATLGGGHIASVVLKGDGPGAGVNPLWVPIWPTIEPTDYNPLKHEALYGKPPEGPLLASILGQNICLDFFGPPSPEETASGIASHGEGPVAMWDVLSRKAEAGRVTLVYGATLPSAQMTVRRKITLSPPFGKLKAALSMAEGPQGAAAWIEETVNNQSALDRPFGWCQHVTTGPPFLEKGVTLLDMSATWGQVFPREFSKAQRLKTAAEFSWPNAPGADGKDVDLRPAPNTEASSDLTTQAMDPAREWVWCTATNPKQRVVFGYVWKRADFPWVVNWEECYGRKHSPWNGKTMARGMEFSTTPFPVTRREAVTVGKLHDTPTYRWIPARGEITVVYAAFIAPAPESCTGVQDVQVDGAKVKLILKGGAVIEAEGAK